MPCHYAISFHWDTPLIFIIRYCFSLHDVICFSHWLTLRHFRWLIRFDARLLMLLLRLVSRQRRFFTSLAIIFTLIADCHADWLILPPLLILRHAFISPFLWCRHFHISLSPLFSLIDIFFAFSCAISIAFCRWPIAAELYAAMPYDYVVYAEPRISFVICFIRGPAVFAIIDISFAIIIIAAIAVTDYFPSLLFANRRLFHCHCLDAITLHCFDLDILLSFSLADMLLPEFMLIIAFILLPAIPLMRHYATPLLPLLRHFRLLITPLLLRH